MRRKGVGDFVTAIDLDAELAMRECILAAHPDHGVLGEERPAQRLDAELVWILDPIDGTSNFGRGLPVFATSVACLRGGQPLAAAVHCFPEDRIYSAALGLGAHCGRRPLGMPAVQRLDDASILGAQWHRGKRRLEFVSKLATTGARLRNMGCTVSQLCDVAVGRMDGNVQEQGKLWDFAAAGLIVCEAGGAFTDWLGKPIFPLRDYDPDRHYPSLAGSPAVVRRLTRVLGKGR